MPRVSRLNIAPVRSLGLEHRDEVELRERGVLEDRRFFVIDEDNRLVDQLIAGAMVQVKAWTDPDATRLRLTFPDGTVVEDEVLLADPSRPRSTAGPGSGTSSTVRGRAARRFLGGDVRIVRCDQPGRDAHKGAPASSSRTGRWRRSPACSAPATSMPAASGCSSSSRARRAHEEDTWVGCRVAHRRRRIWVSGPSRVAR